MQKYNNIKAIFFLGLFSLMVLHQAFPHLHHQHEASHSHSDTAHTKEHHHHEDSSKENEGSNYGFFGFFMDMHVHSTVSRDIVLLDRNTNKQHIVVDKAIADSSVDAHSFLMVDYRQKEGPSIYHPPNTYFNPYLSHLVLRGPPTLG